VKAAIISFGERVPSDALEAANRFAEAADLFIVLGSSLQVQPAAMLPLVAKQAGAALAIVNREATPLDHHADVVLRRPIGSVFAALYPQLVN
jgi:NAD-dependent deacetylase